MDFLGIDSKYENLLWVDKRAYRGFDKDMNMIKYGRSLEKLPKDTSNLLTHKEFCNKYYAVNTINKIKYEKEKLKQYLKEVDYDEYVISVSGGKDSTVCGEISMQVMDELNIGYRVLFGNTSNETHHTYQYVKKTYGNKLEIANPSEGFYAWCERTTIIPTRFGRACCSLFKEGNIGEYLEDNKKTLEFIGVRKDESKNRYGYEQIMINTKWNKEKLNNWRMYNLIIEFNNLDIWSYLIANDIEYNQLYRFGYSRVGCTNCPYRSDYELKLNEYFLPTYDKRWKGLLKKIFIENKITININCTIEEFINGAWKSGIVRENPTDEIIEEFANYTNIDKEKARKYFKQNRCDCGKRLSGDMIALNMKLLGRETNARMCLKCLAEFLGTTKAKLKEEIERFKDEGCNLF
jgi:phosphoadenosine phosphosulfate reductase